MQQSKPTTVLVPGRPKHKKQHRQHSGACAAEKKKSESLSLLQECPGPPTESTQQQDPGSTPHRQRHLKRIPSLKGSRLSTSSSSASPPSVIIWYISCSTSRSASRAERTFPRPNDKVRGQADTPEEDRVPLASASPGTAALSMQSLSCVLLHLEFEADGVEAGHELVQAPLAQVLVLAAHLQGGSG